MAYELPAFCGQVVWGEKLTLQEAIQLAQASSPEAEAARHTYRAAYWSYRSFRADYLPEVSLSASPYLNRQINKVTQPDGTELFLRQNQLATDLTLSVSQNVWFTGGNLFMQTAAQRMDELGEKSTAYNTQPFTVGYRQSLFGYNSLKWNRRIEPVRFQEAKKTYSETLELIASKTCELFLHWHLPSPTWRLREPTMLPLIPCIAMPADGIASAALRRTRCCSWK